MSYLIIQSHLQERLLKRRARDKPLDDWYYTQQAKGWKAIKRKQAINQ